MEEDIRSRGATDRAVEPADRPTMPGMSWPSSRTARGKPWSAFRARPTTRWMFSCLHLLRNSRKASERGGIKYLANRIHPTTHRRSVIRRAGIDAGR